MKNEAKTAISNHPDTSSAVQVDSTVPSNGGAAEDLAIDTTPAPEVEIDAMAEEANTFEISVEPENGDGAESEMMAPEAGPALGDVAVDMEKSKKEKLEFRRRAHLKELEQKERELARLQDDYAKLLSIHAELKDRYLRLAAEMENFRKRLERDFANRVEGTMAGLLAELLPVVDDLERFLGAGNETNDNEALLAGARLIYQNVLKVLGSRGITAMQAEGREFDPNHHEAIMQMAVEGKAPNLVVQENTKGYLINDKVLRPAKVIVSA